MSAFFIPVRQFSLKMMMRQKLVFIGIILVIKCSILADHNKNRWSVRFIASVHCTMYIHIQYT